MGHCVSGGLERGVAALAKIAGGDKMDLGPHCGKASVCTDKAT